MIIEIYQKNDYMIELSIIDDIREANLSGYKIEFLVKDKNKKEIICKSINDGINILDEENGKIEIEINDEDSDVEEGTYDYEIKVEDSLGKNYTIMRGEMFIKKSLFYNN